MFSKRRVKVYHSADNSPEMSSLISLKKNTLDEQTIYMLSLIFSEKKTMKEI